METKKIQPDRPMYTLTVSEFLELLESNSDNKRETEHLKTKEVNESDEVWGIKQTASFLNLSTDTIYGMTSRRTIPYYKIPGRKQLYFKKSLILQWLETGRRRTLREISVDAEKYAENNRKVK